MLLTPGENLGRYVVLDKLGEGGSSVVYGAYDRELDRKVALKLLNVLSTPQDGSPSEGYVRLQREAQAMGRLSHPNVVAIHDVLLLENRVALVMELVEGTTLRAWLKEKPRGWKEILRAFDAAGEGLAAAHEKGLVHRDFKPDNVLVGLDGRVRVADFGIARTLQDAPHRIPQELLHEPMGEGSQGRRYLQLTAAGHIVGTPAYMAPEQIMRTQANALTDQFSFAVTLYEALVGHRPFAGVNLAHTVDLIERREILPPPPEGKVPRWVFKVIYRALSADPAARYPSMAELLGALRDDPAVKRRRIGIAAGLVVLVAAGAALAVHESRQHGLLCTGAETRLQGIWDEGQRSALQAAFLASGAPGATEAWGLVQRNLNRYAADWAAMHREACLDTRVRGEVSDQMYSLRTACLEERRSQLAAVTHMFSKVDAQVVARASRIMGELSRIAECGDSRFLLAEVKPPSTPAAKQQAEAVQAQLMEAKTLRAAGKYAEAMTRTESSYEQAQAIPYVPLQAEALMLKSHLLADMNRPSTDAAREAVNLAESVGADRVSIRAADRLVINYARPNPEEAIFWSNFMRSKLQRLGGNPELELLYWSSLGWVQSFGLEDQPAAVAAYEEGVRRGEAALGRDHPSVIPLSISLPWMLFRLGDFKRAEEESEQLDKTAQAALTRTNYLFYHIWQSKAELRLLQGRYDEARGLIGEAKELQGGAGVENWDLGELLTLIAEADEAEGALVAAEEGLAHAAKIAANTFGKDEFPYIDSQARLWRIRAELGDRDRGLRELKALKVAADAKGNAHAMACVDLALAQTLRPGDPKALPLVMNALKVLEERRCDGEMTLWAKVELGRVQLAAGHPEDALKPISSAVQTLEELGGTKSPVLAAPLGVLGRTLSALHRGPEARLALERAVELSAIRRGPWRDRVDAKAVLARELTEQGELERGRRLAEEADQERRELRHRAP